MIPMLRVVYLTHNPGTSELDATVDELLRGDVGVEEAQYATLGTKEFLHHADLIVCDYDALSPGFREAARELGHVLQYHSAYCVVTNDMLSELEDICCEAELSNVFTSVADFIDFITGVEV